MFVRYLLVAVFLSFGSGAYADSLFHLVHISCVPELKSISVRTYSQYNVPHHSRTLEQVQAENPYEDIEQKYGIFFAESLLKRPFICILGENMKIEIKGFYEAPTGRGFCGGEATEAVEFIVNSRTLGGSRMNNCDKSLMSIFEIHAYDNKEDNQSPKDQYDGRICHIYFGNYFPSTADNTQTNCTELRFE